MNIIKEYEKLLWLCSSNLDYINIHHPIEKCSEYREKIQSFLDRHDLPFKVVVSQNPYIEGYGWVFAPEVGKIKRYLAEKKFLEEHGPGLLRLNEKGQCPVCKKKPISYKRDGFLFCVRCHRHYHIVTKEQIPDGLWYGENGEPLREILVQ